MSDGKILFWYIGDKCDSCNDFYKDFYYANINMNDYCKSHKLEVKRIGFIDETEDNEYNSLCFDVLAKEFFKQYDISEDSSGKPAYEEELF